MSYKGYKAINGYNGYEAFISGYKAMVKMVIKQLIPLNLLYSYHFFYSFSVLFFFQKADKSLIQ